MNLKKYIDWNIVIEQFKRLTFSTLGKDYIEKIQNETASEAEFVYLKELIDIFNTLGLPPVSNFSNIKDVIEKTRAGVILEPEEILLVRNFLRGIEELKIFFKSSRYKIGFYISKLGNYQNLIEEIERILDEDGNIKDSASPILKKIRKDLKNLYEETRRKIDKFISQHSKLLQEPTYTIRNDRYVFPIKAHDRHKIKGIVHSTSSSGATLYVEPEEFIHLNDRIKTLLSSEQIEIAKILRGLSSKIHDRYGKLVQDIELVAHFDSLYARARYALIHKGIVVQPDGDYLKLVNARHPLLDEEKVVPISIDLPSDKMGIVITGPNTGGKTVTLKTIALFIFMAKAGFPILAEEGTRIPEFKLFIDIGDAQAIVENLSTFSSHIVRIVHALENADNNSLVLIDELGSGTDPFEGSALALGILETLIEENIKFIVTTHMTNVKLYAMEHENILTASMEFDLESLQPTYRILLNTPGASHAFEISEKLGLPSEIIEKSKRFLNEEHLKVEKIIQKLDRKVSELHKEKTKLEHQIKEYEELKKRYEKKYEVLKYKRIEEIDAELRELYKEVRNVKKNLQLALHSLNVKNSNLVRKRLNELEEKQKLFEKLHEKVENIKITGVNEPGGDIVEGCYVRLINGTTVGKVLEKRGNKFLVDFKGLKVEVRKNQLIISAPPEETEDYSQNIFTQSYLKTNEIDLRGKTVSEALEIVDKFLDDLVLSNFSTGYIIHGKGTGSLAANIWNFLRNDKRVKTYRFGRQEEGGIGVTVVEV
ncbi:endonuclease MutS2 [Thermosipho ferrireducens]|uniref:Endonuclease MutS2 n=1 Tax=Thermosipho ferrireducens TaxID=2571116 RepID=A0ABX7S5Y1_9BACT|nr:endonuclease MutS2 [Thermosipho ferrireducens]QTA37969.1 endonuclease MutS2 [Thermosipho ferrireducens]